MRPIFVALMLALLVLPFAGCLKSDDSLTIRKDGSGTISSTYSVDLKNYRTLLMTVATITRRDRAEGLARWRRPH